MLNICLRLNREKKIPKFFDIVYWYDLFLDWIISSSKNFNWNTYWKFHIADHEYSYVIFHYIKTTNHRSRKYIIPSLFNLHMYKKYIDNWWYDQIISKIKFVFSFQKFHYRSIRLSTCLIRYRYLYVFKTQIRKYLTQIIPRKFIYT